MGLGLGMGASALGDSLQSIGKYLYQKQLDDEQNARLAQEQQMRDAQFEYETGLRRMGSGASSGQPSQAPTSGLYIAPVTPPSSAPVPPPTSTPVAPSPALGAPRPYSTPGTGAPRGDFIAPPSGPTAVTAQPPVQAPVSQPPQQPANLPTASVPPGFERAGPSAQERAQALADEQDRQAALALVQADPAYAALSDSQRAQVARNPRVFQAFKNQLAQQQGAADNHAAFVQLHQWDPHRFATEQAGIDYGKLLPTYLSGSMTAARERVNGSAKVPEGEKPLTATEQRALNQIRSSLVQRFTQTDPDQPEMPGVLLVPPSLRLQGETQEDALDRMAYQHAAANNLIAKDKVPERFRATPQAQGRTGGQPAATAAPTGGKQHITQDQADYLKTVKGWTDDQIQSRYVVGP